MDIDFFEMEEHALKLMSFCRTHLNFILKQYNKKELDIDCKFSLDTSINAQSKLKDNKYTVIINNGAYIAVRDFYEQRFFGDNKSYYHNITKEKEYDKNIATYYYELMMDITLATFIYHEYGHIYNGHLDYLASEKRKCNKSADFVTLNADNESELTLIPIRHQALEWNADDFSATRVIESFFGYYYWKVFDKPNTLSFAQLFWVVANATLLSYCLIGSKNESIALRDSAHLPAKFRALAFINTAEKKLKKYCGVKDVSQNMINDAIDLAKQKAEVYDINYGFIVSKEERLYYVIVEYELLVKLPIILLQFQHLQNITIELALNTMLELYDNMTTEEKNEFLRILSADGRTFSEDNLRYIVEHIKD